MCRGIMRRAGRTGWPGRAASSHRDITTDEYGCIAGEARSYNQPIAGEAGDNEGPLRSAAGQHRPPAPLSGYGRGA
jgi:hypothetical protein